MTLRISDAVFATYLLACLVFGGASREGFLVNFLLQIGAIGFATWALYYLRWKELAATERHLLLITGLGLLIVVLQFLPLPASIWSQLPGRAAIARELEMLSVLPDPGLVTLSLHESIGSALWALPAIGFGIALLAARRPPAHAIAITLVASALLSIGIGLLQFFGGSDAAWYFYDFTNRDAMVGFFANANHMATLLLVALPFIAALVRDGCNRFPRQRVEVTVFGLILFAFVVMGIGLVGSLTGYALLAPVALASALIVWTPSKRMATILVVPAIVVSAALIAATGEMDNMFVSQGGTSLDGREEIRQKAWPAAEEFFPVGTGLGTFEEVYRRYEDEGTVSRTFINHAHNDYLELLIELGALGVILVALFLAWWLWQMVRMLRLNDIAFGWAGWIASGVILVHSGWDYPLRTAAMSTVFALSCVLVARAGRTGSLSDQTTTHRPAHR